MIQALINLELSVLNFIYGMHSPLLDRIMVFITRLGDKGLLWIMLALLLCLTKKYRRAGITMLLALLINLIIGNITLKPLIARVRPFEYTDAIELLIDIPRDFSFPSGHTFASFASAYTMFLFYKKEGTILLIIAALIAFSRLYLYVHFPSDVLCGCLFGIGVAYVSKLIADKKS